MYINSSLVAQFIVFVLLVFFTMRFIWPPIIKALDERSNKIAEGLAASEKGKLEFAKAQDNVTKILAQARQEGAQIISKAQKQSQQIYDDAKIKSTYEAQKIIAQAKSESIQELERVKESLKEEVVKLAISCAEKILSREIDINKHKDIIDNIQKDFK